VRGRRRVLFWLAVIAVAAAAIWWMQVRPAERRVEVYFVDQADGAGTVVAVERVATGRTPEALLRAALEALLAGPLQEERARGLTTEIPPGTRLLGVRVRDGVAMVDVSAEVGGGGGSSSMQGRLWQIVYTATQLPAARQVRLLLDGREEETLGGEGVLIDRPLSRPGVPPRF
jgi:spore germination protein GerM